MTTAAQNRHYRSIAGTLELFLGAYFLDFGVVAALFFTRRANPNAAFLALAGALFGILVLFRSSRLLGWHRWIFGLVVVIITAVPIAWFIPTLVRFR